MIERLQDSSMDLEAEDFWGLNILWRLFFWGGGGGGGGN